MALFGLTIARVTGPGMEPKLPHGSVALFRRRNKTKRGDVVLVEHPEFGRIVKQVSAVGRKGNVHISSTSRGGESSQELGSVPRANVLGVLKFKLF